MGIQIQYIIVIGIIVLTELDQVLLLELLVLLPTVQVEVAVVEVEVVLAVAVAVVEVVEVVLAAEVVEAAEAVVEYNFICIPSVSIFILETLRTAMQERLDFNSRSPFEIYHILNNYDSLDFHPSYADLFLPEGEGPFSCVVAIHGSRGWQPHHEDHIQNWLASGIAVCKIQSFSSRSVESSV